MQVDERSLASLAALDEQWRTRSGPSVSGAEVAWAVVLPGSTTVRRLPVLGVVLLAIGVVAPIALAVWVLMRRDELVSLALDERVITAVIVMIPAAVLTRIVAVGEVAVARRRRHGRFGAAPFVAAVVVLAMALPAVWAVARAGEARSLVSDVFTSSSSDPVFEPAAPAVDAATTPADRAGVTNVLLLGGDAGPGRWGLRTDTMILVSADRASGRTSLISIPRNLQRLRFPPGSPLAERFPDGFDDLANAVYPYVSTKQDLLDAYGGDGVQPEARAVAEAVGYSLGVRIDDYVLVNMQGFLELVDAVGGVTVELDSSVPLPPNLPGAKREIPSSIGPGVVELDGTLALAFARSRSADSDYQRMDRQRQLLSAVGSQVSVGDAVSGFSSVASALSDTVRTSLSTSDFADLVDTLGDDGAVFESVGLVPPIVEPGRPDYDTIRGIVDDVQRAVVTGEPSGWDAPDA